ncbi:hypothetical protein [Staphylococcus aureus]|uniref:hypothetical protein n=4 Tax=Staphylococcus aureus TaxID=1280 RepID=UPI002FC5E71F
MIEYYLKKNIHLYENNKCEILHLKVNFKDNFDMLSYIYCIENMHRGSNIIKIAEYILVKYFQKYCINKDFSIGPFQVKKSFCVSNNLYLESLDKLLGLHSSAHLINEFIENKKYYLNNDEILSLYHSGKVMDTSFSTLMYTRLFKHFSSYLRKHELKTTDDNKFTNY